MTRGRKKRGSKRLKTPSNSHVVERAVRIGESQQTRRSGKKGRLQQESQLPRPHLPKEEEKKERARTRQTNAQRHSRPSRWTKVEREGRKHLIKTLGAPRDPPLFPCPPKGREEEEEEDPGSETPKEVSAKRKSKAQKEQSLKGEKMSYKKRTLPQFPLSQRPKAQDTTWH